MKISQQPVKRGKFSKTLQIFLEAKNEHFHEIICSDIYRQLLIFFKNKIVLGNLVSEEFQKRKLQICCCNQLFKYVEQLPVTVLFFLFRAFV